jgi:hypothetical protein
MSYNFKKLLAEISVDAFDILEKIVDFMPSK